MQTRTNISKAYTFVDSLIPAAPGDLFWRFSLSLFPVLPHLFDPLSTQIPTIHKRSSHEQSARAMAFGNNRDGEG